MKREHRMPFGAEPASNGMTRFRLWAPVARQVVLLLGQERVRMAALPDGWWEATVAAPPGTRYRYLIDGGREVPDPASRFNPADAHGASEVTNPTGFQWDDGNWQ